jgi:DNA-dependent protein kinase catalytic subunit
LIPIDFGHAFGSATEMLPIPELVPFRLTPQMVDVLDPLGVSGILENAMVNILKGTLRETKKLKSGFMTLHFCICS